MLPEDYRDNIHLNEKGQKKLARYLEIHLQKIMEQYEK